MSAVVVVIGSVLLVYSLGLVVVVCSRVWDSVQRRRAFERMRRITALERGVGFEVSYPEADLPTIRIVRNPNDSLGWRPWVALGFPGEERPYQSARELFNDGYLNATVYAGSAQACAAKARDRLYEIYLAKAERGRELVV